MTRPSSLRGQSAEPAGAGPSRDDNEAPGTDGPQVSGGGSGGGDQDGVGQGGAGGGGRGWWLPVLVVGVLVVTGLVFVGARALTRQAVGDGVRLVAVGESGSHPFTPSVDAVGADDVAVLIEGQLDLTVAPTAETSVTSVDDTTHESGGDGVEHPSGQSPPAGDRVDGSTEEDPAQPEGELVVRSRSPSDEALYASLGELEVCDAGALAGYLAEDDEIRTAWAELMGVEPDDVDELLASLTPLLLTRDTAVTNSAYRGGSGVRFQAVLQAGTPVLVDGSGNPRIQCSCGNPLSEPQDHEGRSLEGEAWDGFDPSRVVRVERLPSGSEHRPARVIDVRTAAVSEVDLSVGTIPTVELDGYLVDDQSGVYVVTEDGARTQILDHPVGAVYDDGAGGLLYQSIRSGSSRDGWPFAFWELLSVVPIDHREANLWHLATGAEEPTALLRSEEPSRHWFVLQGGGTLDGRPSVVYSEIRYAPCADRAGCNETEEYEATLVRRFLDDGEEVALISGHHLWEGSFGPVSMADDRISFNETYDAPAYALFNAEGQEVESGCRIAYDEYTECGYNSVLVNANEYLSLHADETGQAFSVNWIDAVRGTWVGGLDGTDRAYPAAEFNPPQAIDAHGGRAVVSWREHPSYRQLPTLVIDLATDTGTLMDFTGRTRILRSPLVRPR